VGRWIFSEQPEDDFGGIGRYVAPAHRGERGRETARRNQENTDIFADDGTSAATAADKPKPPRDNYWA
jgi:hypothetical protein